MTEQTQLDSKFVSIMLINGMELWGELITFYKPNSGDESIKIDFPTYMLVAKPIIIMKSMTQNNTVKFDFLRFDMASKDEIFNINLQSVITYSDLNDETVDAKESYLDCYKRVSHEIYNTGRIEIPEKKILLNE